MALDDMSHDDMSSDAILGTRCFSVKKKTAELIRRCYENSDSGRNPAEKL